MNITNEQKEKTNKAIKFSLSKVNDQMTETEAIENACKIIKPNGVLFDTCEKNTCTRCGNPAYYLFNENGTIYCDCETCKDLEATSEFKKPWEKEIDYYKSLSSIPEDLKEKTFLNFETDLIEQQNALIAVNNWLEYKYSHSKAPRLIMHGTRGGGKSHLAVSIMDYILNRNGNRSTCMFISQKKLIEMIKSTWNKYSHKTQAEVMKDIKKVDVLIIDDFGIEYTSESDMSLLTSIINERSGKIIIATTNLTASSFNKNNQYKTIYSKVNKNATILTLETEDYRLKNTMFIDTKKGTTPQPLKYMETRKEKEKNTLPFSIDDLPF